MIFGDQHEDLQVTRIECSPNKNSRCVLEEELEASYPAFIVVSMRREDE